MIEQYSFQLLDVEVTIDDQLTDHRKTLTGKYKEKCICGNDISWLKEDIENKENLGFSSYPTTYPAKHWAEAAEVLSRALKQYGDDLIRFMHARYDASNLLNGTVGASREVNGFFTITCPACERCYLMPFRAKSTVTMPDAINWSLFEVAQKISVKYDANARYVLAKPAKKEGFRDGKELLDRFQAQLKEYNTPFTCSITPELQLAGKGELTSLRSDIDQCLHSIKMNQKSELNRLLKLIDASAHTEYSEDRTEDELKALQHFKESKDLGELSETEIETLNRIGAS